MMDQCVEVCMKKTRGLEKDQDQERKDEDRGKTGRRIQTRRRAQHLVCFEVPIEVRHLRESGDGRQVKGFILEG